MRLKVFDGRIDIALGVLSNSIDDVIHSAVIVSLLTDRRANPDDIIPDARTASKLPPDRRGWAGDALSEVDGDRVGSRLWLLSRAKQTEETRNLAIEYCEEALEWLLEDMATKIVVEASWASGGRLDVLTTTTLKNGDTVQTSLTGVIYVL